MEEDVWTWGLEASWMKKIVEGVSKQLLLFFLECGQPDIAVPVGMIIT